MANNEIRKIALERWRTSREFREGIAAALERLKDFCAVLHSEEWQELNREWEAKFGEPFPRDIEDWVRLAARSGVSGEILLSNSWTAADVSPVIEGYLQRLQDQRAPGTAKNDGDELPEWRELAQGPRKSKPGPKPGKHAKRNARIVARIDNGERQVDVARDEGLERSTVNEIYRNARPRE